MPSARTLAAQLPQAPPGGQIRIEGWVHRRRVLATVTFLVVRDRSGLAQVVVRDRQGLEVARSCGEETVISVTGVATGNPDAPGGVEVTDPQITLLSEPAQPPPVDLWRPTLDAGLATILDHAAVAWRHPARRARWQLAAASLSGFRAALDGQGFTEVQTPKFVSTATESGANVFQVDYFGRPAYLAQSPQFYKQTMVGVFERVYETGPVFRAEPHDTARHLAARHAAARRVRDRAGAVDRPPGPGGEHQGGHAVPQGPPPPDAVILPPRGRGGGGSWVLTASISSRASRHSAWASAAISVASAADK